MFIAAISEEEQGRDAGADRAADIAEGLEAAQRARRAATAAVTRMTTVEWPRAKKKPTDTGRWSPA